jgi:formate--tetrahydrofolate ligase
MNILETVPSGFIPLYTYDNPIQEKIEIICKEIYRAKDVIYTDEALKQIKLYTDMGYDKLAICMAKTPASFTDNAKILNAPDDFTITVREVRLSAGAGFIVALTGNVMTMPGLSKRPRAMDM